MAFARTGVMEDVRYALRMLRRSPGFAAFAVLTLALGIGANTAIFSVIDAVLLRPLPYPDSGGLVTIANTVQDRPVPVSQPEVVDYRERTGGTFVDVAATQQFPGNMTGSGQPQRIEALCVSPGYFSLLGVPAGLGRTFVAADETPGIGAVAVISDALWRGHFGADPQVIGRRVELDEDPYTVVGVMPRGFQHPSPRGEAAVEVWVPCGFRGMPFASPPGYGSGRSRTPSMTLKMAVLAPMPSASVTRMASVKPGLLRSMRSANLRSPRSVDIRAAPSRRGRDRRACARCGASRRRSAPSA